MKRALAFIALVFSLISPLQASATVYEARDGFGSVAVLFDTPCSSDAARSQLPRLNELLAPSGLPEVLAEHLLAGSLTFEGKQYATCWVALGPIVAILDDGMGDDSVFPIPLEEFRKIDGI